MKKSASAIAAEARKIVKETAGKKERVLALMGALPTDTPLVAHGFVGNSLKFDGPALSKRGQKIAKKFEKQLRQAICKDFKYCDKRAEVKGQLDKYLPQIVKAILKRIPVTGKIPNWLAVVLNVLGIGAVSIEALIVLLVAWAIVVGLDELCDCKK